MEIREIMEIQRECRKQAKEMTRQAYGKYDAIWTDGVQITPELEKQGKEVIAEINRKMPNMLMRREDRPDIAQLAARHGFANSQALIDYLLAYEPRSKHESKIYASLVRERMANCAKAEIELAIQRKPGEIMAVLKDCREMAREICGQTYEKYDEIWAGKIRITPELEKHGKEVIAEINRKMPNLLTRDVCRSALDQVAMEHRFDSSQELVDWLLDYRPRASYLESICDDLARRELGLSGEDCFESSVEVDEVPF